MSKRQKLKKKVGLLKKLKNNTFLVKVGIAVSGGVDSITLLDILNKLKKVSNLELYVLHYNHKWRENSYRDAQLVKKYCKLNNLKFVYKESTGCIIKNEEHARDQRHSFFQHCSKKYNLKFICTAHHKDDQVETILFRLARGTGPRGLLPIKKVLDLSDNVKIFRPLLNCSKSEIYTYAKKNKLSFICDETNYDVKYKRNLLRAKVIPYLKNINREVLNNILTCSDLIFSQNNALSEYFYKLLGKIKLNQQSQSSFFVLNRSKFFKLSQHTQKSFLYWFLGLYNIEGIVSKIDLLQTVIIDKGVIDLSKDYTLSVDNHSISLIRKDVKNTEKSNSLQKQQISFQLNGRGKKIALEDKNVLVIQPFKKRSFNYKYPSDSKKIVYTDFSKYKGKSLTLRYRKPHDIFQPLGFFKKMKFKKYLINKKISTSERYSVPLLCFKDEILWLPGYSLSERIKVLDKPTHILTMQKK